LVQQTIHHFGMTWALPAFLFASEALELSVSEPRASFFHSSDGSCFALAVWALFGIM
jgi:hypothetical protein